MFLPKHISILVFYFLIILTNYEDSITSLVNKLIKNNTNSIYIYIYIYISLNFLYIRKSKQFELIGNHDKPNF